MKTFFIPLIAAASTLLFACSDDYKSGGSYNGPTPYLGLKYTINTGENVFIPDVLDFAMVGDTIVFDIASGYSARQVSEEIWNADEIEGNGGFSFGEGIFEYVLNSADIGTLYYVSIDQVRQVKMKGLIIVRASPTDPYNPDDPNAM